MASPRRAGRGGSSVRPDRLRARQLEQSGGALGHPYRVGDDCEESSVEVDVSPAERVHLAWCALGKVDSVGGTDDQLTPLNGTVEPAVKDTGTLRSLPVRHPTLVLTQLVGSWVHCISLAGRQKRQPACSARSSSVRGRTYRPAGESGCVERQLVRYSPATLGPNAWIRKEARRRASLIRELGASIPSGLIPQKGSVAHARHSPSLGAGNRRTVVGHTLGDQGH
jgi:hypothetical protein